MVDLKKKPDANTLMREFKPASNVNYSQKKRDKKKKKKEREDELKKIE